MTLPMTPPMTTSRTEQVLALTTQKWKYRSTTAHVIGIVFTAIAVGMLLCAVLEWLSTNRDTNALLLAAAIIGGSGLGLWRFSESSELNTSQVFGTVGWTLILTTLAGALPYLLAGTFAGNGTSEEVVNSIFESVSGYSGTGATAMVDFDTPGRGLLMYRQLTQWFGGMGVVVLAVAVLPFLGVGGLQLLSTEAPGHSSDRLTPRVSETARRLWLVYIALTVASALILWMVPGPSLYDAVAHSLTLVSTGGFSPYGESISHFQSSLVEIIVLAFMVLGGVNFALHWRALTGSVGAYWRDSEFKSYMMTLALASATVVTLLWLFDDLSIRQALRAGVFNAISLGTSTGYSNASGSGTFSDYVTWAAGAQFVLLFLMVVGGCTGSTAGGMKMMRIQVLGIATLRSVRHAQTPRMILPVRLGTMTVPERIVSRMVGFFLLYVLLAVCGTIVLTALGSHLDTALGASISALGNMGPALGDAGPTASYSQAFSQPARLVLAGLMIIGRLEIMTVLLMVVPYLRYVGVQPR